MWNLNIHKRFNYVNVFQKNSFNILDYLSNAVHFYYLQILLSVNLPTNKTLFVSSKSILTILSSFVDMYRVAKI